jgi:hypothetical protein
LPSSTGMCSRDNPEMLPFLQEVNKTIEIFGRGFKNFFDFEPLLSFGGTKSKEFL